MKRFKKHINPFIAALITGAAIFLSACNKEKTELVPEIDRTKWPSIRAENIQSVVSDSGIVKFKITAPVYEVFDKVDEPYWEFKEGLVLKRYDRNQQIDSEIECNYARYLEKEELWRLENEVFARNTDNETFETELLYWDQKEEKIYSDQMVRITNDKEQIICYGFESNQNFTIYTFEKVTAKFPMNIE